MRILKCANPLLQMIGLQYLDIQFIYCISLNNTDGKEHPIIYHMNKCGYMLYHSYILAYRWKLHLIHYNTLWWYINVVFLKKKGGGERYTCISLEYLWFLRSRDTHRMHKSSVQEKSYGWLSLDTPSLAKKKFGGGGGMQSIMRLHVANFGLAHWL